MNSLSNKPRQRRCKFSGCRDYFVPKRFNLVLEECCSSGCKLSFAEESANKAFKATTVAMRKAFNDKDPSYWCKKTQDKCNEYIRLRDAEKVCISCGTSSNVKYDAGHYISAGASAALRFNEFNIHKQCSSYCNVHNSSNTVRYRQALVRLYGEEKVLWLEGPHELPRYRIADYKRIYEEFKLKIKALKHDADRAPLQI